jgi:putative ABC transport system permease protein
MNTVIDLSLWQMAAASVFIVVLLVIVRIKKISRE